MTKLTKQQMEKLHNFVICLFTDDKNQFIEAYKKGTGSKDKTGRWTYDVVCTGESFSKALTAKFHKRK